MKSTPGQRLGQHRLDGVLFEARLGLQHSGPGTREGSGVQDVLQPVPGLDFAKLHFGRKTFRIDFYPQVIDKCSPKNNICMYVHI
jgi:hypothetical protein